MPLKSEKVKILRYFEKTTEIKNILFHTNDSNASYLSWASKNIKNKDLLQFFKTKKHSMLQLFKKFQIFIK